MYSVARKEFCRGLNACFTWKDMLYWTSKQLCEVYAVNYQESIKGEIKEVLFSKLEEAAKTGRPELFRNQDWMVLGPYVMETDGAFETEYMYEREKILAPDYLSNDGGERNIVPYLGKKCSNSYLGAKEPVWSPGIIKWDTLRFDAADEDKAVDDAFYLTEQRNCVYYAAVYMRCDGPKKAVIWYDNSGGRLFLNGEMIGDEPYGRVKGVPTMGHEVAVEFEDGLNLLLFKLRPGYICDTVDLSMVNCSIFPICAESGNLGISYPTVTTVYTKKDGQIRRVYPCFAAAFADTAGGVFSACGRETRIPALKKGQCSLVRAELDLDAEFRAFDVTLAETGAAEASGTFHTKTGGFGGFEGSELTFTSFHFDTTYHQEQRVYALGAFYILKCILNEMRRDDSYKAIISEIDYLHPYYSIYPEDRDFLKRMFVEGRAEADCFYNQPNEMTSSAEGITRNLIYGQAYHRDVLGRICHVYGPGDVFGHFNQISQLSAKGGCDGVNWGKHIFGLPPIFRHVSPDGTSLIHVRGGFGRDYAKGMGLSVCEGMGSALSVVPGYPVDGKTEWMKDTVPRARYAVLSELNDGLASDDKKAAEETGRGVFELTSRDISLYHAGTALTRADLKQANRLAENVLVTAEKLSVIASLCGAKYPEKALDKAWRQLLCGQHHDSITGTNNEVSFVDLMVEYREACELAADIVKNASAYIASAIKVKKDSLPVVIFNPHTWEREEACELDYTLPSKPSDYALTDASGERVPFQVVSSEADGDKYRVRITFAPKLPALGYTVCYFVKKDALVLPGGLEVPSEALRKGCDRVIENDYYRLEVDPERGGGIVSLYDKENKKELIDTSVGGPANRLVALREIHNRMETQHEFYTTGERLGSEHIKAEVSSEKCGEYEKLTVRYKLGTLAPVVQEIRLDRKSRRIDFKTRIDDYRDNDHLFTVTFPVALKGAKPVFDDRFAPQVRTGSKEALSFQTHQYAMFSHCAVYAANQWMDYGPSVTFKLSDTARRGSFNLGMTQLIRAKNGVFDGVVDKLLLALAKKAVPVTVFPDVKQPCTGSQIIHFNEDLCSDTRIILSVAGVADAYEEKLLGSVGAPVRRAFEKALETEGSAALFLRDSDNLWAKPIDCLLIKASNAETLSAAVDKLALQLESGRFVSLNAVISGELPTADDYGVALLNTGNLACSVEKGPMLNMMLFHTAEFYGNIGKAFDGKELVPEQKSHVFVYALLPHAGSYREGEVYRRALEFNDPPFAVIPDSTGNGFLPETRGFVKTSGDVILTALKAGGNPMASMRKNYGDIFERGIALRVFEPHGLTAQARIELGFGVSGGKSVNLLEEGDGFVAVDGNTVALPVTPHSIETLLLSPVKPAERLPEKVLGAEREPFEPTYIRTWEHDLGSMPIGFLSFAAVVGRNPKKLDKTRFEIEVSAANNYTDASVAGEMTLELPDGWAADKTEFSYDLPAGAHRVWPVVVTKPDENAKGILRLCYGHDGQRFEDIFEVGYFNPEMTLSISGGEIVAKVKNTTNEHLRGELYMASPIETWGGLGGHSRFEAAEISPSAVGVDLAPNSEKDYVFKISGGDKTSFWAVAKLCVNGRIHFAGVSKYGERHNYWAHEMINDIYRDGGSLRTLLEL